MQRVVVVGLALVCVCLLFTLSGPSAQKVASGDGGGTSTSPVPVSVANFPASQTVVALRPIPITGSVAVTNFPVVQQVAGTVSVGNLSAAAVRFVGFSQDTFLVPQVCCERLPVIQMSRACTATFPGARACDYLEVVRSIPPSGAWPTTTPLITVSSPNSAYPVVEGNCMHEDGSIGGCDGPGPFPVACCGY